MLLQYCSYPITGLSGNATRSPAQFNFDTDDSMFKYFTDHGWLSEFHSTLSGGAITQAPSLLADYL